MKTVLITGASSGIGKETAFVYASQGYRLILVARRTDRLEMLKKEIIQKYQVGVEVFSIDLAKNNSAETLFRQVKDRVLTVDVLINNAGFGLKGEFQETPMEAEEQMLLLNVLTLTKLTKLFLAEMLTKKSGCIINIASTAAFQGIPGFSVYAATKAYVLHFTEALAEELRRTSIKVLAICPGATESEFAEIAKADHSRVFRKTPKAKELAVFIYQSMEKPGVTKIHGLQNRLMAFSGRFAPRWISTRVAGFYMK